MKVKAYLHSNKEDMADLGRENGMTDEQLRNFIYALYEVELTLEVDENGDSEIVAVDGVKLGK